MNLLYSCMEDLSEPSAMRTHVSEIVNNFAKFGHKVHLIAVEKGDLKLHSNVKFYKLFPFINKRFLSLATLYIQKIHVKNLIKGILKKKNIDVVYERHGEDNATKIAFEMDIPTVLEVNGIASAEAKIQGADKKTVEKLDRLEKEKLKIPNRIVAVTDGIKNYWISHGLDEKKFVVIPNGVNIEFFKPLDKEKCRKELRLDNSPLIVFVGSFAHWQGLECAIKTMPYVLKEIPKAKLILIGDAGKYGGYQFHPTIEELKLLAKEEKVEKNVIFTGRVSYGEVLKYVNAADVCIAPKKHLRSGYSTLKLYEYLACEKAVIGSKANGIGNFLIAKNCGVAVDVSDPTNFAKKMVFLLKNKELRMQMGENGRKSIIDNFSWQKTTKKIEKVLYEVVGDF